jgi:hypothetical protein
MRRGTYETEDAIIRLEYGDVWFSALLFWIMTLVAAVGGALWGVDHKVMVVVRERSTKKVVYKTGPLAGGDDATRTAEEITGEIRLRGLAAFVRAASASRDSE